MLNLATNSNAQIHPARRPQDSAVFRNNDRYDAAFLDQSVPLRGASHAEVTRYSVEVPMRYSECFAILTDGTKVPLANKRQFLAWAGARDDCCKIQFSQQAGKMPAFAGSDATESAVSRIKS